MGAECFLPNGMVEITPAACSNSFRMRSNATIVDKTKPLKYSWEIDHGAFSYSGSGHGISFLLLGYDNQNNEASLRPRPHYPASWGSCTIIVPLPWAWS